MSQVYIMKLLIRNILLVVLIFAVIILSCTGRKNKTEHRDLIPENELISVLTDIYMADGLLSLPKINNLYAGIDSVTAYKQVIEKHGFTQAQLDRTIRFYFIKKPKRFIRIYDKVLGRLSEIQSRIDKEYPVPRPDQANLWQGRPFYSISSPHEAENPEINFQIPVSGFYTLKFNLTIYPDDQLPAPRLDMFIYGVDTASAGEKFYFPSMPFIKDGLPHTYKSTVFLKNPGKRLFIKGWFVTRKYLRPDVVEFMTVDNISLSRSPLE